MGMVGDALHVEFEGMGGRERWVWFSVMPWAACGGSAGPPQGPVPPDQRHEHLSSMDRRVICLVGSCLWISDTDGLRRPRPPRRRGTIHSMARLAIRQNANHLSGANSKMTKGKREQSAPSLPHHEILVMFFLVAITLNWNERTGHNHDVKKVSSVPYQYLRPRPCQPAARRPDHVLQGRHRHR